MANALRVAPLTSVLSIDEKLHRTYTSKYKVIDNYKSSPYEIAQAAGIPTYGTYYQWFNDFDLWAFAKSIKISEPERMENKDGRSEGLAQYIATVVHSTVPAEGSTDPSNQQPRENPLDDPPVISGSFSPFFKQVYRDNAGSQIENSAKHPYVPPVEIEDHHLTLNISFNTATIDLSQWADFRGAVNSGAIWGLEERQVKLKRWGWKIQYAGNQFSFIKHDFEFLISFEETPSSAGDICKGKSYANKKGFYTVRPNSGMIYYEGGNIDEDHEMEFKDSQDQPLTTPAPLTCTGDRADPSSNQKWNVFVPEKEKDFTSIPEMPNPLPGPFA